MPAKRLLMIFVDGLGWGSADRSRNPLADIGSRIFPCGGTRETQETIDQGLVQAIDANLDTPGLPQSATGQTSLLTGRNAAALLGHHLCGYPNAPLKDLLAEASVFIRLQQSGLSCAFANAYQPAFFSHPPRRVSVTTAACQSAGLKLKTLEDLRQGQAVYQDFTHRYLRERGIDIDLLSPETAGANLAAIAKQYNFVLYEYFLTDRAGHSGDFPKARKIAEELERFLAGLLQAIDLRTQSVLLVSDHGNLEEMSHSSHTRNPVYCIAWGPIFRSGCGKIDSIVSVLPAILLFFDNHFIPSGEPHV